MNCRYCQDRRGGCLYCPAPPTVEERIAQALEHLALRGLAVVHFVATEPEEQRRAAWIAAEESRRRPRFDFVPGIVCAVEGHRWEHYGERFRSRLCRRCERVEHWRWLPACAERNGEWSAEDEPAPAAAPKIRRPRKIPI